MTMRKRLLLFLLPALLMLLAGGLAWAAVPEGDAPLEPGLTTTPTPILTEFGYLPVAAGDEAGPTVTATSPPPTPTLFTIGTSTPAPGTPGATTQPPTTEPPAGTATATTTAAAPTATPTATLPPTDPTPAPREVFVTENYSVRTDRSGRLQIVGEVINNSKLMVRSLAVTADLYDGAGRLLSSAYAPVQLDQLHRGDSTCFVLSFDEAAGWQRVTFGDPVFRTDVDAEPNLRVRKLETAYDPVMGWFTVTGQVRNKQDEPAELVQLVGTVYDGSGTVTGCAFAFVGTTNLEGQQKGLFEMVFTGRDFNDVSNYKIQVEGRGN